MINGNEIKQDWFILFTKSKNHLWIMKWFNPDFQHCYMMRRTPGGTLWMVLDPVRSHLHTSFQLCDDYPHPRVFDEDAVILPVRVRIKGDGLTRKRGGVCWFSCVEVCKATLGIKKFWVLTPYQLYKHLRSMS